MGKAEHTGQHTGLWSPSKSSSLGSRHRQDVQKARFLVPLNPLAHNNAGPSLSHLLSVTVTFQCGDALVLNLGGRVDGKEAHSPDECAEL